LGEKGHEERAQHHERGNRHEADIPLEKTIKIFFGLEKSSYFMHQRLLKRVSISAGLSKKS
jgi:hypothetical protein